MKNLSFVKEAGLVEFPEFQGERVYMLPFTRKSGLPSHLNRWSKTVSMLLEGVDVSTDQDIYLMIDQKEVRAGQMHRRGGVHIDGYWNPSLSAHTGCHCTGRHGGHRISAHTGIHGTHMTVQREMNIKDSAGNMVVYDEWPSEALILASNVEACRAWNGLYDGVVGEGGDCSHVNLSEMEEIILKPHTSYHGNVTMLHESLPMPFDCQRTLVRLNVPGWTPSLN